MLSAHGKETAMTPAIETLMNEHRLIEKVLGSLETFAANGGLALPDARGTVARFGRFFREFADRIHHAKEEDRLFAKMIAWGFPAGSGPIAVMLAEHGEGRTHVGALCEISAGEGPLSEEERVDARYHAEA